MQCQGPLIAQYVISCSTRICLPLFSEMHGNFFAFDQHKQTPKHANQCHMLQIVFWRVLRGYCERPPEHTVPQYMQQEPNWCARVLEAFHKPISDSFCVISKL